MSGRSRYLCKLALALASSQAPYTVAAGETLSGIASRVGSTWQEIARLNGISDPKRLTVGQRLTLPAAPVDSADARINRIASRLHSKLNNPNLEAAILANFARETGGRFDHSLHQAHGGGGYGLPQYTGPSLKAYKSWLAAGKLADSADSQVDYFVDSYMPTRPGYRKYTAPGAKFTREQYADWLHRRVFTPAHVIRGNKAYSEAAISKATRHHNDFMKNRIKAVNGVWQAVKTSEDRSSGLVKSAKALKVLNRLFGKASVLKWRQMAAAKNRGLIHDISDKLVFSDPKMLPGDKRWGWIERLGNEGLRDLTYNPLMRQYSFSASPRHLDAIDPTGWLRREFMATQGGHGYSPWTSVPEQFYTRRDRTLVPDWVGSSVKPTVHEMPMRITASEFSRRRIQQALDRALARSTPGRGELRELPPDQAGYLIDRNNAFNSDKIPGRELSDAITKTLSQDMVNTGFAGQSLAGAARIMPYSRYDVYHPFLTRNHLKSMHGIVPVAMGRDHYSNAEAQVLPFARRVLLPVSWKFKAPSPAVSYDQETLAHEMGHIKGGVLGTLGPRIFSRLGGWAFPGLRRRSLLGRKPLMAAALNGSVGPEYVANRIAFGTPVQWPERIHSAYDTYLLGELGDMMKGRAFSPEEYSLFMRNYLPNGVPS